MMMHAKGRYTLLKELEQLKHSLKTKNAAANKVTTQCKTQCQNMQSLTKEKIRPIIGTYYKLPIFPLIFKFLF